MEKRLESELNRLQFSWPRAAVLQVIHLWEKNECLYNPKHELYHSKRGRNNALAKMTNELRRYYPEITSFEVKNKITYLRSQYAREISRIKEKRRTDGEAYVPSVFWYSDMEFLKKFVNVGRNLNKSNKQSTEQVYDSCESLQKGDCDESSIQDCKRSRVDSSTPVSNRSMSQESPMLLARSAAPLDKASLSYSANDDKDINIRDVAFCNYIRMELNEIKNKNIKDNLIEKIMLAVFNAKKELKLYGNDLEKCFEDI